MENIFLEEGAFIGRKTTDFAGGTLPFELRVSDSDWNKAQYLPTGEKQRGARGDRLNCVTQSNHNSYELQLNQMIADNTIRYGHLAWLDRNGYIDSNGKVNFSEKFNSILNKTAEYKGNWLYKVADDVRLNGLIPQSMLPEKIDEDWDTYYNPEQITPAMLKLGKEFLDWFELPYEWVDDTTINNLVKQLQHTPLQIVYANHAVAEIKNRGELMTYYDSYEPWVKNKTQSSARVFLKLIINQKIVLPEEIKIIKDTDSKAVGIWYAARNQEELITKAIEAGFPIPRKSDGSLDWDMFIQGLLTLNNKSMISEKIKGWLNREDAQIEEAPIPTEEVATPIEEAPIEEVPTPTEEVAIPIEEAPIEEAPIEEAPIERVPSFL